MSRITMCTALVIATWATGAGAEIPAPADAPKPRAPDDSAHAFRLPDGFRMEAVAAEPLIASPTSVCWDERGRMFVSELHGYNLAGQLDVDELNKTGKLDTQVRRVQADEKFKRAAKKGTYGVVKLLLDTDGDRRMDQGVVWATDLPPVYGLVPARGGVIAACAPDIVYLSDADGSGKPIRRETLFTGFATGELERGINAPQWGDDGWIYFGRGWGGGNGITGPHLKVDKPLKLPNADFRIRPDGSAIEPVTGGTHTFGFATTEAGDRFVVNTTVPAIYLAPLPWRYLVRNPDAASPSGVEAATGDRHAYSISKPHPWRQRRADDPAYFKYYNSRYGAAESEADDWFTAACGPMIFRDHALPGLHGQYLVCEPAGNLIHRAVVEPDGPPLKVRRAPGEEKSEFCASDDAWSHPIRLSHGPDGAIWVCDFYREIIEDYSAIPRHLQQQYGVTNGQDKGRVYRLTHRDAPAPKSADMSGLSPVALAGECASDVYWRRQTAQRLLVERRTDAAATNEAGAALRKILANPPAHGSATITALRTLAELDLLTPADVRPLLFSPDPALRIHALQTGDRWFAQPAGADLLGSAVDAAGKERDPRVAIQFALSLGEAPPADPRALATLIAYARDRLDVRWMDAAILSSLGGRGADALAALAKNPGRTGAALLAPLAQSVAAHRDPDGNAPTGLARAIELAATAPDTDAQLAILTGLAKGRKTMTGRATAGSAAADAALARLAASASPKVRAAARDLQQALSNPAADREHLAGAGGAPADAKVTDDVIRKYTAALAAKRDLDRGHEVFRQACAVCHQVGGEGHALGPDLIGELGVAEETLVRHVLLPNDRIRPGFETTMVETAAGDPVIGILKDDGATSLTVALPGGVEETLLRKDVTGVRPLAASLMPSFAEALSPADLANLLGWLRSNLRQPAGR